MSEPSAASFVGWYLGITGIKEGSRLEWNYGIFTASSHSTWEGSEIVIFKEEEKATELKRDYFIIKVGWEFIRAYSVWIILSCQLKGERRYWALEGISLILPYLPTTPKGVVLYYSDICLVVMIIPSLVDWKNAEIGTTRKHTFPWNMRGVSYITVLLLGWMAEATHKWMKYNIRYSY